MIRRTRRAGRSPRWRAFEQQRARGIYLLPALLTTANLACGFYAILLAAGGRPAEAAGLLFVAMVMDVLDGRVARLMRATSQFGVEYDSLADVVSFSVAPAFLLYTVVLAAAGRPAWFGAVLFVVCGALRLARFNVHTAGGDRRFFTGLPTPAAAGLVAAAVLVLGDTALGPVARGAIAAGVYPVALLMVSTFRYWSFKEVEFGRRRPYWTLLALVLGAMVIATQPQWLLFSLFTLYALSGPFWWLVRAVRPTAAASSATSQAAEPGPGVAP